MRLFVLPAFLIAMAPSPTTAPTEADAAKVRFTMSAAGLLQEGSFERVDATASFVGEELDTLDVTVHVNSLATAIPTMTAHLLSTEVLDAAHHPTATFHLVSARRTNASPRTHTLTGELTIRGVQRSVTLPITAHAPATAFRGHGTLPLHPSEFGIRAVRWTDPEVEIALSFEFKR